MTQLTWDGLGDVLLYLGWLRSQLTRNACGGLEAAFETGSLAMCCWGPGSTSWMPHSYVCWQPGLVFPLLAARGQARTMCSAWILMAIRLPLAGGMVVEFGQPEGKK